MNPQMIINSLLQNNPMIKSNPIFNNAMQMMQTGNTQGLKSLAENLAKEKGVNINDVINQITNMRN